MDMPVSWNRHAAVITTSASCSRRPWSATMAGSTPRRLSRRNSRSAMLQTICTCTQEWSDIPSRPAVTCWPCQRPLSRWSALAASSRRSSLRLPRAGALICASARSEASIRQTPRSRRRGRRAGGRGSRPAPCRGAPASRGSLRPSATASLARRPAVAAWPPGRAHRGCAARCAPGCRRSGPRPPAGLSCASASHRRPDAPRSSPGRRLGSRPARPSGPARGPARSEPRSRRPTAGAWRRTAPACSGSSGRAAPWRCRPRGRYATSRARRRNGWRTGRRSPRGAAAAARRPAAGCTRVGPTQPGYAEGVEPLVDGHGRLIGDLRVSVTDRCNFRCQYCMPAEGLPWLNRDALLSYEEIERLVRLLSAMGVHDVRLTGGEPLVRRELWRLVEKLSVIEDVHDLSLTTNGYLLERQVGDLVGAGLKRVNVSLDALAPDRFFQLTRRDSLQQVLDGLAAAQRHPELRPIKVNVVALRDFTEAEVVRFADFARTEPYVVRFIEFMPLDADRTWSRDRVLPNEEVRRRIDAVYPLEPVGRERHGTSRRWRFADGQGEIGFISPVTEPFCGDCNRIRLTAEGELRTCLFSMTETDLREPLRSGATDADLEAIIRDAVWRKELKHHVNDEGFVQPARTMSRIGG